MHIQDIVEQIKIKKSFLCVGLDTDEQLIPAHLKQNFDQPILEFNKRIIDATHHVAIAYKINTAFYEALGSKGWDMMKATFDYIPKNIFKIADAKRGDIGNTAKMYAKAFFDNIQADAITVSPYMGLDSIEPFLAYQNKTTIVLGLTSNEGAKDFQMLPLNNNQLLFENVIQQIAKLSANIMFVVGATQNAELLQKIRKIIPNHFLLVPGIGAQGGDLQLLAQSTLNNQIGIIVNSSRQIIYARTDQQFADAAKVEATKLQQAMAKLL